MKFEYDTVHTIRRAWVAGSLVLGCWWLLGARCLVVAREGFLGHEHSKARRTAVCLLRRCEALSSFQTLCNEWQI